MTASSGYQLSGVLGALGAGRRALPAAPASASASASATASAPGLEAGGVGAVRRVVEQFGASRPVQADGTTCGSAALVVLAAAGDPVLARWLATGTVQGGRVPPELGWLTPGEGHVATPTERFAGLQHAVKRVSLRRGLVLLPWPGAVGTPPWGAARVARFGDVRYTHRLVVDTRPSQSGPVLDHAVAVARQGIPVLLYTGGDTRGGLGAAVPRHVVVLSSPDGQQLEIYEPSCGRMLAVTRAELAQGGTARAAYGGWSHVTWAVVPDPAR